MPWTVYIHRAAQTVLRRLDRPTRQRIAEQIHALGHDPDDPALDVKPLVGRQGYRLRVGGWPVLFMREDAIRVIRIERIKPRGDVYK